MTLARFFMLLSLVLWLGGLLFFAFVLAPTVFSVLPMRHLAGNVVHRSLGMLHWIGIASGIVYLASSILYSALSTGSPQLTALRNLLVLAMIALTLVAMFAIQRPAAELRARMGVIDDVPQNDPRRLEFNRLHRWSTRVEGTVMLLGLAVLYLTSRRLS